MNYIALIAMAAIAAVAVWRVLSLSKSHAAVTAENTALKLDLEKARNADAVELATTRQALESLRAAKAETEEAYARRVDLLAAELQQRLESLTALREENARLATSLAHFEEERENREQHDKRDYYRNHDSRLAFTEAIESVAEIPDGFCRQRFESLL